MGRRLAPDVERLLFGRPVEPMRGPVRRDLPPPPPLAFRAGLTSWFMRFAELHPVLKTVKED